MTYNPETPKISSIFSSIAYIPKQKIENTSFAERVLSLQNLAKFYGTDESNIRAEYHIAFVEALKSRIREPLAECGQQGHACFFKPYSSVHQGFLGFINGTPNMVFTLLAGLGIFGNIYVMIGAMCLPALIELVSGIVSLGQALFYKIKSLSDHNVEVERKASEYLLDAVTRFVLVIPLVILSFITTPIDIIRFVTRSISTLMHLEGMESTFSETMLRDPELRPGHTIGKLI